MTNLVPNPGFEAGDNTPWLSVRDSLYPGTSLDCSGKGASSPYSGSYACAVGNLASGALQSASIAVSGNKQYDLYAWLNGKLDTADSAGGWHVRALYYTAGSAYIGYKDVYTGTAESSSLTWQQVGGRLLTPANAASVRLELRVEGVSGWLDFDDVSLQEVLTVNLVYDAENRLVKVLQNGTSMAAFGYDGDGLRVKQTLTTTTATSTYFVKNYYEVSGGSATKYYYAGSQRVAMRSSVGVRYLFGDHLGSTSVSADVSGGNVTRQLYKAFGEIRYSTNPSLPAKYQYTGQYSYTSGATGDFGLIFYNARFYDPALGRFAQADRLVPNPLNPSDFDRYNYVGSNPINFSDPFGNHRVRASHDWECGPDGGDCQNGDLNHIHQGKGWYPISNGNIVVKFKNLPVLNPEWVQPFGSTVFAKNYGPGLNYTGYCRGYHCGVDLGGPAGTPVYSGFYGYVANAEGDTVWVYVGYKDNQGNFSGLSFYKIKYQHVKPNITAGNWAGPNDVIGYIVDDHAHVEVRWSTEPASKNDIDPGGAVYIMNPFYFMNVSQVTKIQISLEHQLLNPATVASGSFTNEKTNLFTLLMISPGPGRLP